MNSTTIDIPVGHIDPAGNDGIRSLAIRTNDNGSISCSGRSQMNRSMKNLVPFEEHGISRSQTSEYFIKFRKALPGRIWIPSLDRISSVFTGCCRKIKICSPSDMKCENISNNQTNELIHHTNVFINDTSTLFRILWKGSTSVSG